MLHCIGFLALVGYVLVASAQILPGAQGLVIQLKEEAAIQSNVILLKDVADLRGPDPNELQNLALIELGKMQDAGSVALLTRQQIRATLQSMAIPLAEVTFSGAELVRVRMQRKQADPDEIAPLLQSQLLESTSWKGADLEIRSLGGMNGVELPSDHYEVRISSRVTLSGPRRILALVEIVQGDRILRRLWVTADVTVRASILTAAKPISRDQLITPEDVVETTVEVPDLRATYARRPEDLLGKASRRVFSPGDPLTRDAFAEPFLVRHGDTVQLHLERNGIVLTSLAKAEQDGRMGQIITVRNIDFSTTLKAEVTGPASVRVQ